MQQKFSFILLSPIIATAFLLSGCGSTLHTPMSEMLMFQEKESIGDSTYYANFSQALISTSTDFYNIQTVNNYALNKRPSSDPDDVYDYEEVRSVTTNMILMPIKKSRLSFSLAIGNPLGLDLTGNIFGNTYLTSGFSAFDDKIFPQLILQQRILDGNPFGLSIGITAHKKSVMVSTPTNCPSFYCSEDFDSKSIGLRSVIILTPIKRYGKSRPFFYGVVSVNYDLILETVYPRLSLSFGIY